MTSDQKAMLTIGVISLIILSWFVHPATALITATIILWLTIKVDDTHEDDSQ